MEIPEPKRARMSQSEPEGGNIQTPSSTEENAEMKENEPNEPDEPDFGKSKYQCKNWIMVWNNYDTRPRKNPSEDVFDLLREVFEPIAKKWVFGKEVAASGTPHIQGAFTLKQKMRAGQLMKKLGATMTLTKMNSSDFNDQKYCIKDGDYITNHKFPKPIRIIEPDYWWEQEIINEIENEPCDRTVNWLWSSEGNTGKTSFCKYLVIKHGAIILGGKAADIKNGIVDYVKKNGDTPELVVVNIPRSQDMTFVSYQGLEEIKDMCFYSGKYEGAMVVGNPPHLYIFANSPPDERRMSEDRWVIRDINPTPQPSPTTLTLDGRETCENCGFKIPTYESYCPRSSCI